MRPGKHKGLSLWELCFRLQSAFFVKSAVAANNSDREVHK